MAYALAKSGHGVKVFEKSNGSPTVRAPFCPKAKVLVILLTAISDLVDYVFRQILQRYYWNGVYMKN